MTIAAQARAAHDAMRDRERRSCRWWLAVDRATGERQLVRGATMAGPPAGYPAEQFELTWVAAPGDHGCHEGRRWVADPAAAERAAYAARLAGMNRLELVEHILALVAASAAAVRKS